MPAYAAHRDLRVRDAERSLAGSLWLPSVPPLATVLMHPGSGPSDRDNGGYFAPIRAHLLDSGFAVCSFDKRGVGGSTGRWQEAGIVEQADDVIAAFGTLRAEDELGTPIGLFGHSQGGWVVVDAASRGGPVAFVISNSGPGVSPADQERYSSLTRMERSGADSDHVARAMRAFDALIGLMREGVPFADVRSRLVEAGFAPDEDLEGLGFVPENPAEWDLAVAMIDYDPRPALTRIAVPVLALFGRDDAIVPVDASVAVYRATVRPELLSVAVLSGGDHRVQTGEPPRLVDSYLEIVSSFIARAVAS